MSGWGSWLTRSPGNALCALTRSKPLRMNGWRSRKKTPAEINQQAFFVWEEVVPALMRR
jgi:hypothetical protein